MNDLKPRPFPNFFLIGAPKAGTSALYHGLKQHPEIFMSPVKEPHFFSFEGQAPLFAGPKGDHFRRTGIYRPFDYLSLFASVAKHRAVGEASTTYLGSPIAARRIGKSVPGAKVIALLRQPADRAYSHYQYLKAQGAEDADSFETAIAQECDRKSDGWFSGHLYVEGGFYFTQLSRFYDAFPRDQIKVYLYDDWNRAPHAIIHDLFDFLEVDGDFVPEIGRKNVTLVPRNSFLNNLAWKPGRVERLLAPYCAAPLVKKLVLAIQNLNRSLNLYKPPPLAPETHRRLTAGYSEDIMNLQNLIGRDLTHWLNTG